MVRPERRTASETPVFAPALRGVVILFHATAALVVFGPSTHGATPAPSPSSAAIDIGAELRCLKALAPASPRTSGLAPDRSFLALPAGYGPIPGAALFREKGPILFVPRTHGAVSEPDTAYVRSSVGIRRTYRQTATSAVRASIEGRELLFVFSSTRIGAPSWPRGFSWNAWSEPGVEVFDPKSSLHAEAAEKAPLAPVRAHPDPESLKSLLVKETSAAAQAAQDAFVEELARLGRFKKACRDYVFDGCSGREALEQQARLRIRTTGAVEALGKCAAEPALSIDSRKAVEDARRNIEPRALSLGLLSLAPESQPGSRSNTSR